MISETDLAPSCAAASEAAGEPLAGTAPTARAWLLWEARQPWGAKAPLPTEVTSPQWEALQALKGAHGAKLLWIRRPQPNPDAPQALLLAEAGATPRGVALRLEPSDDIQSLTQRALYDAPGARPFPAPLFVVCVHGKRDLCCARLGLPVWRALCDVSPAGSAWQCSHLGGHRFAPTLLVLPWGYSYGRLTPDEARDLPAAFATGKLAHLHKLRGRCDLSPPAQAAEVALRQRLGLSRLDAVAARGEEALAPDRWRVILAAATDDSGCTPSALWVVEVASTRDPSLVAPASCGDTPQALTTLTVLSLQPMGAP